MIQFGPERAKLPFPLSYPAAQADGAVKSVHGTGTAAFLAAVRIRSALDGTGFAVLDTLIVERWYLGEERKKLQPRAACCRGGAFRKIQKGKTTWL